MNLLLAADIGGTQSRIIVTDGESTVLRQNYPSVEFASAQQLLQQVISDTGPIQSACLAVAGPVNQQPQSQTAKVTNLPWLLDSNQLKNNLKINQLQIINDFEAIGYGLSELGDEELLTLQAGNPQERAPGVLIGAGTGLGQALLLPRHGSYRVHATEGGHVDFAPTSTLQQALLDSLSQRYNHVSVERLLSGSGLVTIFTFLADRAALPNSALEAILNQGDPAANISALANEQQHPLALQAMKLFMEIYGAQAGNLALSVLPYSGLFIAGGIASKNIQMLQQGEFLQAFLNKGRMSKLLQAIPVKVVLNREVGLLGALKLAKQQETP